MKGFVMDGGRMLRFIMHLWLKAMQKQIQTLRIYVSVSHVCWPQILIQEGC